MRKSSLRQVPKYVFLVVASLASVFPLYFMVVSATNSSNEVLSSKLTPGSHLFDNFAKMQELQCLPGAGLLGGDRRAHHGARAPGVLHRGLRL